MSVTRTAILACLAAIASAAVATATAVRAATPEPIRPIPAARPADPARLELGRRLFYETRLSANNRVSCASCHDLGRGGVDGKKYSLGFDGRPAEFNTPTVYNAAFNFRQAWKGGAPSLKAQIDRVVRNPVEMGSNWEDVVRKIALDSGYRQAFSAAYRDGVNKDNIQDALATFSASLTTPGSRFDLYLAGNAEAITPAEKAGYAKFKQFGCVSCHQGVNVGGNMFQKFGVMGQHYAADGRSRQAADASPLYKVPGLRNVALTAPYFHDGSAATLEDAVGVMIRLQLGRVPARGDVEDIVAFLKTLTGETAGAAR